MTEPTAATDERPTPHPAAPEQAHDPSPATAEQRRVNLADYLAPETGEAEPADSTPEAPAEAMFSADELAGYLSFFTSVGVDVPKVEAYQKAFMAQSRPLLETLGVEDAQMEYGLTKAAGAQALPAWARLGAAAVGLAYITVTCRAAHGAPVRRSSPAPDPEPDPDHYGEGDE